ncbi:MAG TPA: NAD(P)/FAD-dependent oxidoreductase [Thermoplasmata archaeon]|nr:NAD(P)/FAD-dependent oxidoreductase [Thermoplasmata archaeon]HIH98156.1 NAD(P)/FAD-dependent oxidoreductase [Thermoplasmata archaeon]
MKYDVAIIGGGFAGLSMASILSKKGFKTALFEKSQVLGGRGGYIEKEGFLVDYGVHLLRCGAKGEAAKVFEEIGKKAEFVEVGKPEIFIDGKFKKFPSGAMGFLTTGLVPFGAKFALIKVLLGGLKADLNEFYRTPMEDFISQKIKKEKRRKDIEGVIGTLGGIGIICSDLKEASAGELFGFVKRVSKSKETVGYVKHGMKHIIDTLKESIIENGGEIKQSTPVKKIVIEEEKAKGVETDSEKIFAENVVYAAPLQNLNEIIAEENAPAEFMKKVSSIRPTQGVGIEIALKESVTDKAGVIITSDPLTMGCFTSNATETVAPSGKQLASFFYPITDIKKSKEAIPLLKRLIREMFPNIQDKIEWELERTFSVVDGAMPTYQQSYLDRPDFQIPSMKNLYLIGDTTKGIGSGGDIAFNSALKCSDLLIGELNK